jgi:hypothetical protein
MDKGIIIGVIGAIIGIIGIIKSRKYKALSYKVEEFTPMLSEKDKNLKLFYKGEEIKNNVFSTVIKIINSGNMAIKLSDYEGGYPITIKIIEYNSNSFPRVFAAKIIKTSPEIDNLKNVLHDDKIERSKIVLEPIILNPRDSITLKIWIETKSCKFLKNQIIIDARIAETKVIDLNLVASKWKSLFSVFGICFAFFQLIWLFSPSRSCFSVYLKWNAAIVLPTTLIITIFSYFVSRGKL